MLVLGDCRLCGLNILVVEDEFLVALELEEAVAQMGALVTTVGSRAEALDVLANGRPDGAILDVQLGDGTSYDVADQLVALDVPFVFTTGFDRAILPPHLRDCPRLSKPFAPAHLQRLVTHVFSAKT
ncbi:MAG: response regulator [Mesorhizobium sp.]|uniref:response regulator n=1 Tax=Mesorhizobium sp. TaxID=1871066 RepID=UPI00121A310C|nr:response regulator [Mesorhizobium sp.]TIQ36258.1 MAG: response regulator [Mesorhizobium sp.]